MTGEAMSILHANRCRAMTLTETMFSLSIGTLVLAILLQMFLVPLKGWRESMYGWALDSQARQSREKILRGLPASRGGGNVGLRAANLADFSENGSSQLFFDVNANGVIDPGVASNSTDLNTYVIKANSVSKNLVFTGTESGAFKWSGDFLCAPVTVTSTGFSFFRTGIYQQPNRDLTVHYILTATSRGKTYTRHVNIRTYIRND